MTDCFEKKFGFLPANFIVFAILLLIGGGAILVFLESVALKTLAIFGFGISAFIFSIQTGLVVDFKNKVVLRYWSTFGIRIGKWNDISDIKYIAVVSIRMRDHFSARSCTYTTVDYKGRINVILNKKKYFTLYQDKKEIVLQDAMDIARGFGVRLFDNSTGEKRWLDIF